MWYEGAKTKEISFPLGGIGTGCIGLGGNGGLVDFEIKNRPNKNTTAEFTHFAVKVENEEHVIDCRVLQGDLNKNYIGCTERPLYTGYGFGPDRGTMAGFPHFEKVDFYGEYPIAEVNFFHEKFPGAIKMTAFSPLIPTNEDDSSIPAAFFEIEIENTTSSKLKYTVALSCNNFYSQTKTAHLYEKQDKISYIFLGNNETKNTTEYGDLTIATDCTEVSYQEYWFRGRWFDNSSVFWNEFSQYGKLKNRTYKESRKNPGSDGSSDTATLAAHINLNSGERRRVRFILSWSNPYMHNFWEITHIGLTKEEIAQRRAKKWKNYYAVLFPTSRDSAIYGMKNFSQLYKNTDLYRKAMFSCTLPEEVLDAVTANIAALKSPSCLRLEDGSFYGFEGVHAHVGSCEGTCTHVWSYAYAPAFLFPALERSARTNEYTYSMQKAGGLAFRVQLPLGEPPSNHRPAVDGQYGSVLRVYREFLISGDINWLKGIWPEVKRSVEYAWDKENIDQWDMNRDGIMEGRQHHTLDMELFGPNAWLSGMYLSGLLAAAKMAQVLGDQEAQSVYMSIFHSGKERLNHMLFNGEYFYQKVNLKDKAMLEKFHEGFSMHDPDAVASYWNTEAEEMKYQAGEGCMIDQVLGQWHADMLNLGEVFEEEKTRLALHSIYKYNFIGNMREFVNPCRIYSMNDERGTVICSYPENRKMPFIPVPYAGETMTGFEYQAASHMIRKGLIAEGRECVKAVRDRYDGEKRNPWNEIECGSNYVRSMSSYALLLAYSGFSYDMYRGEIGFHPIEKGDYKYFWSLDTGFGTAGLKNDIFTLQVCYGHLKINSIDIETDEISKIIYEGKKLGYIIQDKQAFTLKIM
ncbi:GH116 family glycosyl-hydrolase [Muricomes intestini]|uniref:GH116 family glycosyl-hydrolase n=1 Tax=Muricomes intestini TaxID=1796634 RepID=UPI002FE23E34